MCKLIELPRFYTEILQAKAKNLKKKLKNNYSSYHSCIVRKKTIFSYVFYRVLVIYLHLNLVGQKHCYSENPFLTTSRLTLWPFLSLQKNGKNLSTCAHNMSLILPSISLHSKIYFHLSYQDSKIFNKNNNDMTKQHLLRNYKMLQMHFYFLIDLLFMGSFLFVKILYFNFRC